jgi:SAM-dependent methyltransferase
MPVDETQQLQDRIWRHYQDKNPVHFGESHPRYAFLASRCRQGERVLNIGSGDGGLEVMLQGKGASVFVLDPSEETVARLRTSLDLSDTARLGHSQAVPFGSGSADVVIMTEVLEHLTESALADSVKEVFRVLVPGGRFIGTVPYAEDLDRGNVFCPHCQQVFHQRGHLQSFTCGRLKTLLTAQGFTVRKCHARAFAHWGARTIKGLARALFRDVLERLKEPIVSPNIYFESIKPSP